MVEVMFTWFQFSMLLLFVVVIGFFQFSTNPLFSSCFQGAVISQHKTLTHTHTMLTKKKTLQQTLSSYQSQKTTKTRIYKRFRFAFQAVREDYYVVSFTSVKNWASTYNIIKSLWCIDYDGWKKMRHYVCLCCYIYLYSR